MENRKRVFRCKVEYLCQVGGEKVARWYHYPDTRGFNILSGEGALEAARIAVELATAEMKPDQKETRLHSIEVLAIIDG